MKYFWIDKLLQVVNPICAVYIVLVVLWLDCVLCFEVYQTIDLCIKMA